MITLDASSVEWVKWALNLKNPKTVLDISAGEGQYGKIIKDTLPESKTTGVEPWAPYIKQYGLSEIYDTVHVCDARIYPNFRFDMVILGDTLEYMTRMEFIEIWRKARLSSKSILISVPKKHSFSGDFTGNPFQISAENNWTHSDIISTFDGITGYKEYETTTFYLAEV